MNEDKPILTTPLAIIIGSLIISLTILLSNGVIKLKTQSQGSVASASIAPSPPSQPLAKTEADIIGKLKIYAGKLNLDQEKFARCLDSGEKASIIKTDQDDGIKFGINGTPGYFINGHKSGGAIPYEWLKTMLDFELNKGNWNNLPDNLKSLVDRGVVQVSATQVSSGSLPILGNPAAPVTIVEFSDFQCPFCGSFYRDNEKKLRTEYIDSGKVKFSYRDFPLTQIHLGAQKAAEAARCADDQTKFWSWHDLVFENQTDIF